MAENEEMEPTVIKRTQDTLGKYVKKPPLTEKLLKKPPFRFLHDVFKAVIKETGCFDGLYSVDELNFENIKDRDDKMRFLQKMIDVVKLTTQRDLNVRTSKIVAGHEPQRTNELLQMMGEIIEQQMEWKSAVEAVANGMLGTKRNNVDKAQDSSAPKKEDKGNKIKEAAKSRPTKMETKSSTSLNKESKNGKNGKNSKNATPSPDEKAKKMIKTVPRTKEKTLTRQTTFEKEKVSKEPKEKEKEKIAKKSRNIVEKSKVLKRATKDENDSKRTSPSTVESVQVPVKLSTSNESTNMNSKIRQKSVELSETKPDIQESNKSQNEILFKGNSSEKSNDSVQIDDEKPDDKIAMSLLNGENVKNGEIHATDTNGSRKSSANDEEKSQKTSTSPQQHAINHQAPHGQQQQQQQQIKMESSKSLKMVNGNDMHTKATNAFELSKEKELKNEKQQQKEQQQQQQQQQKYQEESPKGGKGKRAPTLAHENSRDSVASNSNSSAAPTRPRTSLRPPSARPPSARPGAPRRRDKNVEIILQANDQIKMSNINVKLETFGGGSGGGGGGVADLDDDGENLVIIEDATSAAVNFVEENKSDLDSVQPLEQQGHLVQQILETQKELTQQQQQQESEIASKMDKAMDNSEIGYDANARESSARQMNNLRDIIQNLSKSVSPFGKLMDFIPEDIDAMQMELNMWRDTYVQAASDLKRERSLTESSTEPMKNQLLEIDANIQEYSEMIDASRVKILQNYDRILKMLLQQ